MIGGGLVLYPSHVEPLTVPAPPVAPTWFTGNYPDRARATPSTLTGLLVEPVLPPAVARPPFVGVTAPEWVFTAPWRAAPAWFGPVLPQAQELPPFGWWPDYPTTLPLVIYTADITGVVTEGPQPVPRFRRTLQWRIGSRTEPEKL